MITESARYDQSQWAIYGARQLQDVSERGSQQDSAEYFHKLIEVIGLSKHFAGLQARGQLSFDDKNFGLTLITYPEIPYIQLPLTIEDWNRGNHECTIGGT